MAAFFKFEKRCNVCYFTTLNTYSFHDLIKKTHLPAFTTKFDAHILASLFVSRHTLRYAALDIKGPAVICFWHDELLPFVHALRAKDTLALVSGKRVGVALAKFMRGIGHDVVFGSSSRDGVKAVRQLLSRLDNEIVMIACDGPRGPRHEMKHGALYIAEKAGIPLILARAKYRGMRLEKSWDKFLLPHFFSKVEFVCEHFDYNKSYADNEAKRLAAEKQLSNLI